MYIRKLCDENIGPLKEAFIKFPFAENGNPKPIIFVGENGSGKSTILSNIVDAFYSFAEEAYDNAMLQSDINAGKQYYKAILSSEIHTGCDYMYSYIDFLGEDILQYYFKSGEIAAETIKNKLNSFDINLKIDIANSESNLKKINSIKKKDIEKIFSTNVICYFGPDRYEKPVWMGNKYLDIQDLIHFSVKQNWAGILKNPIKVTNVTETNLQWLLDIIADSRPDVEEKSGQLNISRVSIANLMLLRQARENIESIMSAIMGKNIYFALNFRNQGASRFRIIEKDTNLVLAPTLDSLSTGQIALFNMFSTIVRYADTNNIMNSINLDEITGIVVIDEIELHLHTKLQKEVLPKLIKLFPKVQFVITTHAPLFLLGMQEEFGDDGYEIYEMPSATKIDVERFSEFQHAYEYFKQTALYQEDARKLIEEATVPQKTLVITEGATDWKHMKAAMNALQGNSLYIELFENLIFDFFEYEPANSKEAAKYKLEMGNTTLVNICENYAKLPQDSVYIFIADRDDSKTNTKLNGLDGKFKKWAKNVYSFIIPIPKTRIDTPDICIEHLYSDDEIRTEIEINNIKRRLYMGNEFDERGIAFGIDRHCEKSSICGSGKINIIEGSKGDKITCLSNIDDNTNYALSKMNFAKYVTTHPEQFDFTNFVEIFEIIKEIIEEARNDV